MMNPSLLCLNCMGALPAESLSDHSGEKGRLVVSIEKQYQSGNYGAPEQRDRNGSGEDGPLYVRRDLTAQGDGSGL